MVTHPGQAERRYRGRTATTIAQVTVAVALAIARIDPGRAVRCDQLRAGCPSARRVQRLRRAERTVSVWFAIGC